MFILNDLSIEGQYIDSYDFKIAVDEVINMRNIIRRSNSQLYCYRSIVNAQVTRNSNLQQVINKWDLDSRRAFMTWITKQGPFWEDKRYHLEDDYLENNGNIITDSGVGEAAVLRYLGHDSSLVSFSPSSWECSPVIINWYKEDNTRLKVEILNFWKTRQLEEYFEQIPVTFDSWESLESAVTLSYSNIVFALETFELLKKHPFAYAQAFQMFEQLGILNRLKGCHDETGKRTFEGHEIVKNYFTGNRAWFSDSSNTEKIKYKRELTFPKPGKQGEYIFCPWHGKVSSAQGPIRIHFSWPSSGNEPLYVVYVGPKLTKR